ncbi:TetR/AcrR family transcriptional regulator [Rhodococcus gannanensis]|uniref:TetR/AcrR family transcriptional regulator n=1 Tax=Rhodococcus gannanensis TaxID=1960308 RepID=A0ABW4P764_9NOCA
MAETASATRQRRGTLRDEQKRATRARLVESARTLFGERGYAGVTVDDIASDVGCSRATFYLHFPAKVDVLRALTDEDIAQSTMANYRDLDRVLETGSRAEFVAWVTRAIGWFQQHRDLLLAWDEATVLEPDMQAMAREGRLAFPNAMPGYLARWPEDRRDEARLRIALLSTQLEGFFTRWALQGTIETDAELAAEVLADIWFPALVAPDPE